MDKKAPVYEQISDRTVHAKHIEIPFEDWKRTDCLEGYPRPYDRKLIQATLADGNTDTGWVYIMNRLPARAKIIQSGDWEKPDKEHLRAGKQTKKIPRSKLCSL